MKSKIEIDMNNSAFAEEPTIELARIFRILAREIEYLPWEQADNIKAFDINGNSVGVLEITEGETEDD